MKNLINRLATGALILGGALTSFSQMGCGSSDIDPVHREQELAAARLFGGLLAASPKSSRREAAVGRAIYNSAENQADRNAYGNQSVGPLGTPIGQEAPTPQPNYAQEFLDKVVREKLVIFFWNDVNRNREIDIENRDEIVFTDVFNEGEWINSSVSVPPQSKMSVFLKAGNGRKFSPQTFSNDTMTQTIVYYNSIRPFGGKGTILMSFESHLDSEDGPMYAQKRVFYKAKDK